MHRLSGFFCFAIDWADVENRIAVITPHKCEVEKIAIFKIFKPFGISSMFFYRVIKLFDDTGDVKGRQRSERARTVKKKSKKKIMPREMGRSENSMSCMFNED